MVENTGWRADRIRFGIIDVGLALRAGRYNKEVRRALRMEQAGTGCVIAPDSTEGMSALTKDKQSLEAMYRKGWQDAEKLVQWYRAAKAEA